MYTTLGDLLPYCLKNPLPVRVDTIDLLALQANTVCLVGMITVGAVRGEAPAP